MSGDATTSQFNTRLQTYCSGSNSFIFDTTLSPRNFIWRGGSGDTYTMGTNLFKSTVPVQASSVWFGATQTNVTLDFPGGNGYVVSNTTAGNFNVRYTASDGKGLSRTFYTGGGDVDSCDGDYYMYANGGANVIYLSASSVQILSGFAVGNNGTYWIGASNNYAPNGSYLTTTAGQMWLRQNSTWQPVLAGDGTNVTYASNTWSLAGLTNGMARGSYKLANSNGVALYSVFMNSSGAAVLKQLAP